MTLKLLDLEYLRAQNSGSGQVLITTSSTGVTYSPTLVVSDGKVGIGTAVPASNLTVKGSVEIIGSGSAYVFADGSTQSTAAVTMLPGGSTGAVQFNGTGIFAGVSSLYWDNQNSRLGIGTDQPRATLQIKDVGYESTDTVALGIDEIVLDSFPVPDYRSCHYIVQVTDTNFSWFHTAQVMLIHDGLNAFKSEYNIVVTNQKLGEFNCRVVTSNVEFTFTPFYTSDKNIKVIRTSIEP